MIRRVVLLSILLTGFAGIGWELLWQVKTALAIGVSAQATALVVAATMGGMTIGTLCAGVLLRSSLVLSTAYLIYGLIELCIGLFGISIEREFIIVSSLDTWMFQQYGHITSIPHLLMIVLTIGPPAMAMGASIPLLGLVSRLTGLSLALLYGLNTLGAAIGILLIAFVILPLCGMSITARVLAISNCIAAILMFYLWRKQYNVKLAIESYQKFSTNLKADYLIAFISGFAIFALEVGWFRAMRAAFLSTTHSFASMLAAVLLALALGAHLSAKIPNNRRTISNVLGISGILVLLITPITERLDIFGSFYIVVPLLGKFLLSLGILGPAVAALGIIFPLLLERRQSTLEWGLLHASNTVGAVLGALIAAWVMLPLLGFAYMSMFVAALLILAALALSQQSRQNRIPLLIAAILSMILAYTGQSGLGKTRIMGLGFSREYKILGFKESPDFTVSAIEDKNHRSLFIDGFSASSELGSLGYMSWMGRLPMMLHPTPNDALVICFGTGNTANAVRLENPLRLEIVDISKEVFEMAPFFRTNENVLKDPRVNAIVMDGRAWLRRTTRQYDVITLEPMPPTFAGVNNLYSLEFYQLAHSHLNPAGTIAQWLPFHLLTPDQAFSIARTFNEVFPDSMLWLYPPYKTGILIGQKHPAGSFSWPGLSRQAQGRELSPEQIMSSVQLSKEGLVEYSKTGLIITDDNQYLAYGSSTQHHDFTGPLGEEYAVKSFAFIEEARLRAIANAEKK